MVKAPRDENAPRKPLTPYFAFQQKHKKRVVKTMPTGYSLGELSKKIAVAWANASESEKEALKKTHANEQKKYQKMFSAYKLTGNYQKHQIKLKAFKEEEQKKAAKFRKDENAPKRPHTAYFCFMADKRESAKADNPDLNNKELITKLAKMWNDLSDAQKKPYQKEADKKKAAYEKQLAKYKQTDDYKRYQEEKAEHVASLKPKKVKAPKPKIEKAEKKSKTEKTDKKSKKPKDKGNKSKDKGKKAKGSVKKAARKATKKVGKAAKSKDKKSKKSKKR